MCHMINIIYNYIHTETTDRYYSSSDTRGTIGNSSKVVLLIVCSNW